MENIKSPLQTWDNPLYQKGKKYRIPCTWEMFGVMDVEAESLDDAIKKIEYNSFLPNNAAYVDLSFKIDHNAIESYNEELPFK